MRPQLPSMAVATVFALCLGVVAAAVAALVGPSLQVVMSESGTRLSLVELLGPRLGGILSALLGFDSIVARDLLDVLPLILVVLAGAKALLSLGQWYLWERAGERASKALRSDLLARYVVLDPSRRREDDTREREASLSSLLTTDVSLMREFVVKYYGGLPREALQVLFLGVTLVLLSPKLFLIFALGVVPAAAVARRIGKKLRRRAARALEDYSDLSEWLQQRLLGVETIKHYKTEAIETAKFQELTESLLQKFMKAARVKARTSPALEGLAVVFLVIVLVISLRDVAAGDTSGAVQLSFFSSLALLSQSAAKLGRYLNTNREGLAAVERVTSMIEFMDQRRKGDLGIAKIESAGETKLIFDRVTARYPGAGEDAVHDFSYVFKPGRVYCLCGPSGAGKSTVVNLALSLLEPIEGQVLLEIPSRSATPPGGTTSYISYMPQKVSLVADTLAANVSYPDEGFDAARIHEALVRVGLAEFVSTLERGLATEVGEGGLGLSGGQAQRVLLARLYYHWCPVVLVDEGTSALDPEVEELVHGLLTDLAARGAVVVTIAHRMTAIKRADEVLLLKGGKLVEHGLPDVVLASKAFDSALG